MVCLIAGLVLGAEIQAPLPPYKRMATVQVYASSYDPRAIVEGNRFYAAWGDSCQAFDLPSMKRAWSLKTPGEERAETVALNGGVAYVTTGARRAKSRLIALNATTGKVLWTMPRTGEGSPVVFAPGLMFVSMKPYTLSALDLKTRNVKWTATFGKAATEQMIDSGQVEAAVVANGCVVANCEHVTYSLDAKSGRALWKEPASYVFHAGLATTGGVVWVPSNNGSVGRDVRSGKVLWRAGGGISDFSGVMKGRFVGLQAGKVVCIDPRSGKTLWSHPVGDPNTSGGRQYGFVAGDRLFVSGINRAGIYDLTGRQLWAGKADEALPGPCWTDGRSIVCFDGLRLIRYEAGKEAGLPSDPAARRAIAQRLVDHFADLDDADKKRLKALGDDAFVPLLQAFVATCHAHDAMGEKGDSYPLYSRYHDIGQVLDAVAKANRTPELVDALTKENPDSSAKPALLTILARVGDPKVVTPYFIKELEGVKTPGFEMYESNTYVARTYIAGSSDPRAVAFMLKQLRDPKADSELRVEAYENLAGTGGEEGLKAVLAERNRRQLLRPVGERAMEGYLNAGEFGTKTKPLGERDDSQGHHWGLLQSGVLGSSGDLWLAEKVDGHWTHALFTGVTLSGRSRRKADANRPPPEFDGKTAEELAKGAWFSVLVGNAELSKDTDGDGLTDIEEKRLGTDPAKADTDGDGDPDGIDPWPNAPNRTDLSDAEQVLAAAFEARYHFNDSEGAGIFTALPGIKPFEMPGRRGTMMWVGSGSTSPLSDLWEQGAAFITFQPLDRDESKPWEQRLIQWSGGHTEAKVLISTYFGGLNGTGYDVVVRKFGHDWVVVSMHMAYIS